MSALILSTALILACPPIIEVKQAVRPIEGWAVQDSRVAHKYFFAQFSDGPPSRETILMHDSEYQAGKNKVLRYQFLQSQDPWLICSYTGTSTTLARRLPNSSRTCELTLDHAHNFETVSRISCQ